MVVTRFVTPKDPLLQYSGYVHEVERNTKRADFDRAYGERDLEDYGHSMWFTGGLRISWRSDAWRIAAHVHYKRSCAEDCAVDQDDRSCYLGRDNGCRNSCRLTLSVDGRVVDAPGLVADQLWRDSHHDHELELPVQGGGSHDCRLPVDCL